ncbi:MAG: hypothetical protein AUG53_23025 [Delftia sp. 13_1_20CM_4_67_18]|nr:MAG: hypothetical protein AUG53_23025 [Delftia sp. 13_1_20CM_4_67_18]
MIRDYFRESLDPPSIKVQLLLIALKFLVDIVVLPAQTCFIGHAQLLCRRSESLQAFLTLCQRGKA